MRSLLILTALASIAQADPIPKGFAEVPTARSPGGTYTVIWPDLDHVVDGVRQNRIIELATGKEIATIDTDTVFTGESHATPAPTWIGKALVWHVEGKWGSRELSVIWIGGKQLDVREQVVGVILRAVERAAPRAYAIAKREGQGDGSWFRDGLAIDVRPTSKTFPLTLAIDLTSDPKCLDGYPKPGRIAYRATARLDATGKLTVGPLRPRAACR